MTLLPLVILNNFISVDWQLGVGIDNHTEKARICLKRRASQIVNDCAQPELTTRVNIPWWLNHSTERASIDISSVCSTLS